MRKASFIFLCLFTLAVTAGAIWYGLDTNAKLEELRRENDALIRDMQPTGGAETSVQETPVSTGYQFPIHPDDYLMLTSAPGYRISPVLKVAVNHQGLDIAAVWRAQVMPIDGGVVVDHWPPPGAPHPRGGEFHGHPVNGGFIVIRHEDGTESEYAHLAATFVRIGQRIHAGQVIGRIGDTGVCTGPHLHLGMKRDGKYLNPLLFLPDVRSQK
jgi:murein DD-endopeptidase MepM/ murein hydrolase activator NlpD